MSKKIEEKNRFSGVLPLKEKDGRAEGKDQTTWARVCLVQYSSRVSWCPAGNLHKEIQATGVIPSCSCRWGFVARVLCGVWQKNQLILVQQDGVGLSWCVQHPRQKLQIKALKMKCTRWLLLACRPLSNSSFLCCYSWRTSTMQRWNNCTSGLISGGRSHTWISGCNKMMNRFYRYLTLSCFFPSSSWAERGVGSIKTCPTVLLGRGILSY